LYTVIEQSTNPPSQENAGIVIVDPALVDGPSELVHFASRSRLSLFGQTDQLELLTDRSGVVEAAVLGGAYYSLDLDLPEARTCRSLPLAVVHLIAADQIEELRAVFLRWLSARDVRFDEVLNFFFRRFANFGSILNM
jgi:hypothetical protein